MLKWFKDCKTIEDVKRVYKTLAVKYHPDFNRDTDTTDTMQEINNEYETAFNIFKDIHAAQNGDTDAYEATETTETPDMFKDIINSLIHCDGVQIDIVGSWVWLTGNTFIHKDVIKSLGFKWASKKKAWYWHTDECKSTHSKMTLDEIKTKYGCQNVKTHAQPKLA